MTQNNRKGFTIVDVILILILITIMAASGMGFYISLNQRHQGVKEHMTAINLATAQIEDLIALENYDSPDLSAGTDRAATIDIPIGGYNLTYTITNQTYDGMEYKQITASATTPPPISGTVQLIGYKAKQ